MKNNVLKIIFVIIGALVGAGFASGQEINLFFFSYGIQGIYGIMISSFLLGITIYKTLKITSEKDIKNYKEFLEYIVQYNKISKFKDNSKIKKYIIQIINIVVNIFILITFFIMIAGFGTYLQESISINKIIGSTILAVLCILILSKDLKGIVKVSQLIASILILFIVIIGACSLKNIDILNIKKYIIKISNSNWLISSILYASYNTILLLPILISVKNITKKNQIAKLSVIITIIIMILALSIYIAMIKIDVNINNLEMPISYIVSNQFPYLKILYGIVILASILTTAISLGEGLIQNICKNQKNKKIILIFICITSIPISQIGFSNLINILYPIFGYLGLIQIIGISRK